MVPGNRYIYKSTTLCTPCVGFQRELTDSRFSAPEVFAKKPDKGYLKPVQTGAALRKLPRE